MPNHENLTSTPLYGAEQVSEVIKQMEENVIHNAKKIMAKIVSEETPIDFKFAHNFMCLWFTSDTEEEE